MSDPFEDAIVPFFEGTKDKIPDVKALADLLRDENKPLPPGFRAALAELLDSRLAYALACNWALKPAWIGRYDSEQKISELDWQIPDGGVTNALARIADERGIGERTLWDTWKKKIKPRRDFARFLKNLNPNKSKT